MRISDWSSDVCSSDLLNFGSRNAPVQSASSGPYKSQDKYLFAAQDGVDFKPTDQVAVRLAGGYFRYSNVEGKVSAHCQYYEMVCSNDEIGRTHGLTTGTKAQCVCRLLLGKITEVTN